jgi:hypothetical protein
MNTLSKKIIIPMAAVAVVGAGLYGTSQASADNNASTSGDPRAALIQKLADTFHLDKAKVQEVFDQDRAQHEQAHEANYEARLSRAVANGQLTDGQKDAILAEHKQLKAKLDAARDKTGSDRRAAMDSVRQAAESWAQQNNLDVKWLIGGGHLRGAMGAPGGQPEADAPAAPAQ